MKLVNHLEAVMDQCDEITFDIGINGFPHKYLSNQESSLIGNGCYEMSVPDDIFIFEGGYYRRIQDFFCGRKVMVNLYGGHTKLQLKHTGAKRNLQAVLLTSVDEADDIKAGSITPKTINSVLLLETGVISAMYLATEQKKGFTMTLYPEKLEGFADYPYQESNFVLESLLESNFEKKEQYMPDYEKISTLVEIAKNAHQELCKENPPVKNIG